MVTSVVPSGWFHMESLEGLAPIGFKGNAIGGRMPTQRIDSENHADVSGIGDVQFSLIPQYSRVGTGSCPNPILFPV